MKQILLLVYILISTYLSPLVGQSLKIGVEGGPSWSKISAKGVVNEESRSGFHVSVWVEGPLKEKLSFQTGVGFIALGSILQIPQLQSPDRFIRWRLNFNYLTLPIMVKFSPHKRISFRAGFYNAFLVGYKVSREASFSNTLLTPDRQNLKTYNVGYQLGANFNYYPIFLGLTYRSAFSGIATSNVTNDIFATSKNSSLEVSLGYTLHKTK